MLHKSTYFPVIDSLRGLASVMVCLFHYVCTTTHYVSNALVLSIFNYGSYGVHIFFIISGIVIPLSMLSSGYTHSSFLAYLYKRMARIEPPYIVSILVFIVYAILKNSLGFNTNSTVALPTVSNVLAHIGYLVPLLPNCKWFINTYWSLAVEFQYYLVLCIVFPYITHAQLIVRCLVITLFLSLSYFIPSAAFLPHWTPLFTIGIAYVLYIHSTITKLEFIVYEILAFALVAYLFSYTVVVFCLLTLLTVHCVKNFKTSISLFFGKISYSLYLIHGLTGGLVINYLSHSYTSTTQQIMVVSIGFGVATLCAYFFYLLIEKPSQLWAKKIIVK
jgi:peptidoglycan/LPS O-acetylase OafA/YrhL